MSDLIDRDRAIAALDPDNIFPEYIVQTMIARIKELPAAGKGRRKAEKVAPPVTAELTTLEI